MIHADDKPILINTLNKRGILLEEKTRMIIDSLEGLDSRNSPNVMVDQTSGERIEIDASFEIGGRHFLVECKRTDNLWIFPRNTNTSDTLNMFFSPKTANALKIKSINSPSFLTSTQSFELEQDNEGRIVTTNKDKDLGKRPQKGVHNAVRQLLKNLEAYITVNDKKLRNETLLVPIIVTNTELGFLNYSSHNLDKNGDLIDYKSIEFKPYLVFNFPQQIKGNGYIVSPVASTMGGEMKSLFIVNVNHLSEFVEKIKELDSLLIS